MVMDEMAKRLALNLTSTSMSDWKRSSRSTHSYLELRPLAADFLSTPRSSSSVMSRSAVS
jgi:hypothetical protein